MQSRREILGIKSLCWLLVKQDSSGLCKLRALPHVPGQANADASMAASQPATDGKGTTAHLGDTYLTQFSGGLNTYIEINLLSAWLQYESFSNIFKSHVRVILKTISLIVASVWRSKKPSIKHEYVGSRGVKLFISSGFVLLNLPFLN